MFSGAAHETQSTYMHEGVYISANLYQTKLQFNGTEDNTIRCQWHKSFISNLYLKSRVFRGLSLQTWIYCLYVVLNRSLNLISSSCDSQCINMLMAC